MNHDPIRPGPVLSEADAAAVDAWARQQGLGDVDSVGTGGGPRGDMCTTRVAAVERLLGLLGDSEPVSSEADRRLLVDVTFARVLRARDEGAVARLAPTPAGPTLSGPDARAIDELVESGWRAERGDGRARRAHALLSLIDDSLESDAASDRERLVSAALSRVQREVDAERSRLRFTPVERPAYARPGIRWRDLAAIAAMFVIACSIFWPMVDGLTVGARRAHGQANMQQAALGFGMFANDHDDRLPALDNRGVDGLWWQVGTPEKSHSANLYTLVRTGYVPIEALASPGNPTAATEVEDPEAKDWASNERVSYSYQLFGKVVPHLATFDGQPGVVMADRSPIVERAMLGLSVNPAANSANEGGLGQLVLFADGRVRFLETPTLDDGDNIWLPRNLEQAAEPRVVGTELPASRTDAFVGP